LCSIFLRPLRGCGALIRCPGGRGRRCTGRSRGRACGGRTRCARGRQGRGRAARRCRGRAPRTLACRSQAPTWLDDRLINCHDDVPMELAAYNR
jgi:hypothetical protein